MSDVTENAAMAEPVEVVSIPDVLPVMALRDAVVFPYALMPLTVGRERSILAVNEAMTEGRLLLLLVQKSPQREDPTPGDLHHIGCVARIMRMMKAPDGTVRVLVQGLARAAADYFSRTEPHFEARVTRIEEPARPLPALETTALVRAIREGLERISAIIGYSDGPRQNIPQRGRPGSPRPEWTG